MTRQGLGRERSATNKLAKASAAASLCALMSLSPCRAADPGDAPDDDVIVFGTRLSAAAPQPAERIMAEQIEALDAITVADLLRQLPGITAIEPGGPGGVTELFLRGADANFATVFVDGVRMNDPTDSRGGAFDFSAIAPDEVERIEVVRGPFSALYGSGALAGAIHIDTRRPATSAPSGSARVAAGSDGYWQAGAGIAGPLGAGRGGLNVNYADFGEPTPESGRTVASVSADFSRNWTDNVTAGLTVRMSDRERESYSIASGGPRLAVSDEIETADADDLSIGASLLAGNANRRLSVQLTLLQRNEFTASPAVPDGVFSGVPASISDAGLDRYGALISSTFMLAPEVEMAVGAEYQHEEGSVKGELDFGGFSAPTDFRANRSTISPFVEGRLRATQNVTLFAGLRYDGFSDVDSATSPRVGAVFGPANDGPTVTAAWGEARKAPSFYALGDPLVGNADLEPEDSEGFDIGIEIPLRHDSLKLSVSGYRYNYSNLIDFDFATFQLVNRSDVDTTGLEVRLRGEIGERAGWSIFAATLNNDVDGVDNALLHRPERSAGGYLSFQAGTHWLVTAAAAYEGRRPSSSIPGGGETLDSYTRFNLAIGRTLINNLSLRIAIDNLFDTGYEAVAGFPAPGRQLRIGLRQGF